MDKRKNILQKRFLPSKKDIIELYKNSIEIDTSKIDKKLNENVDALFKRSKAPNKNINTNINPKDWQLTINKFGVFYYNKNTKEWMNSFGVIKNSFEALIETYPINSFDYNILSGGEQNIGQQIIFSSDGGEYLGLFDDQTNILKLYSVSYTPEVTSLLENEINIPNDFKGTDNQKCLISSDGQYVIVSIPENKQVYFIKTNTNTILQTLTEDVDDFGSLITADKDFLGLCISTKQLNKSPSIYDVRQVSYGASTPMYFYKRNFDSNSSQKFKKIHNNHAQMVFAKNGLDGKSYTLIDPFYVGSYEGFLAKESSIIVDVGVFRFSDLQSKNYNFATSTLALKQDQIDYRSCFINYDSPRYLPANTPGLTLGNGDYPSIAAILYNQDNDPNSPNYVGQLPTDNQQANVLKMLTLPGVKQFTIINKVNSNYYEDKSYLQITPYIPVLQYANIPDYAFDFTDGATFFNQNIVGSFAEKTHIRGMFRLFNNNNETLGASNNITPFIDEQTINTKVGINDTHTYHVSQILTGVTGEYIKNIRIYRTPNTAENNHDIFTYQDWNKTSLGTTATASPNINDSGLIKILYNSTDQNKLEDSFFNKNSISNNLKTRLGLLANKPYLQDPTNCPNSEFAYTIDESILSDLLENIFISNNFIFLNFGLKTILFTINSNLSYKPIIFEKIFDESFKNYKFVYNASGEYFYKENKIYKFDSNTQTLTLMDEL